jgi:hypothetical protein
MTENILFLLSLSVSRANTVNMNAKSLLIMDNYNPLNPLEYNSKPINVFQIPNNGKNEPFYQRFSWYLYYSCKYI